MTASTDELAALRRAVVAAPGDDTVRLAYADRLDESGAPANRCLARFIRHSVRSHAERGPDWPAVCAGSEHGWARKAWRRHHGAWWAPPVSNTGLLADPAALVVSVLYPALSFQRTYIRRVCWFRFSRGFMDHVTAPFEFWAERGPNLCAFEPVAVGVLTWPVGPQADVALDRLRELCPAVTRWETSPH